MDPRFIQLGNRIFAVDHIVAIKLDYHAGISGQIDAVALFMSDGSDPWVFHSGTPEAKALTEWSTAMMRTTCLVDPPPPPSLSE